MNKRLGYFAAGALAFVLCGFGIPGPQGSSAAFTGGTGSPIDSLVLDVANGDVEASRKAAGAFKIQDPTGSAHASLFLSSLGDVDDLKILRVGEGRLGVQNGDGSTNGAAILLYTSGDASPVWLRNSAASTLTVDGDGSGTTAAKLAVSGIAPMTSGQSLVLYEDDGAAALTIDTVGNATFGFPIVSQSASVSIDGAGIDLSDVDSITWSSGAFYSNTDDTFLTRAEANVLRLDGDGSGTTAGRLAVSGIAPMSSSTEWALYGNDGTEILNTTSLGINSHLTVPAGYVNLVDDVELILGSGANEAYLGWETANTNDALVLALRDTGGATSDPVLIVTEASNVARDHDLAEFTDPAIVLFSSENVNTDNTEWASLSVATGGAFTIDTGHGGHAIIFENGGVERGRWNSNGLLVSSGVLRAPDGSASAPAYSFSGDTDTGFHSSGGILYAATAGADRLQFRGTGLRLPDDMGVGYGNDGDVFEQGEITTLTDNVATTVFSVVTGDGDMAGVEISYFIQATDGTEYQAECGEVWVAIVDDAGGVVSGATDNNGAQVVSSGTLTSNWTVSSTDDGSIEVQLQSNTSLTPTTFQVRWKATVTGDVTLTVP